MLFTISSESNGVEAAMRGMFEARKQVFVDLLGWDVPVIDGRYEIDQFDDVHARYLILTDQEQRHLASARLLPTLRPHILDSLFGSLCEEPPPKGRDIYEITRFCLGRGLGAARRRQARGSLLTGIVGHALATGITTYVGVAEIGWFQQLLAFGWHCRPLGPPKKIGSQALGALQINITPETPALLASTGIYGSEIELRAEAA